ncbi:unnamed protein product [Mytilus edulis]|uniref:Uncharacterized protein n=1 Tax=Mytilus edulis TaxID=6550 RepID=A0A8S3T7D1_MYTED|nr:unnamed protein product [Mytilus edulis]
MGHSILSFVLDLNYTRQRLTMQSESKAKDKTIDDLKKELSNTKTLLQQEKAEREKLNHQHEKMISDLKHTRGKNLDKTLKEENDRLKHQIDKITIEKEDLGTEVDRLRTSLSKVAGDRMMDGNPYVTDLSDPNRPQRLAENSTVYTTTHGLMHTKSC